MTPVMDLDRLRDDPVYSLVWTVRLAVFVIAGMTLVVVAYWLGWWAV